MSRTRLAGLAALLTLLQLAVALVLAPAGEAPAKSFAQVPLPPGWTDRIPGSNPLARAYLRLNNWDSFHYFHIAREGYVMPERPLLAEDPGNYRANVVFFPAYPLAVRAATGLTGMPLEFALPFVSQLFCWLFWLHVLLLLSHWGLLGGPSGSRRGYFYVALLLAQPALFFFVMGYAESVAAAAMVAFVYWSERWLASGDARSFGAAAASGFLMTATRIVGIPLLAYPVLRAGFAGGGGARRLGPAVALSFCATLGAAAFFAWCQWRFGRWDVYYQLQLAGWGNLPDWWAAFKPGSYLPRLFFEDTLVSLNRAAYPAGVGWGLWLIRREARAGRLGEAAGLLVGAFGILLLGVCTKANVEMMSLIRILLPAFVLLALVQARGDGREGRREFFPTTGRVRRGLGIALLLLGFAFQLWLTYRFLRGRWVA